MLETQSRGAIAWMAKNSVAANLLMLFLLIGGLLTTFTIKQEIFPEFDVDIINITVPYPGTNPEEVENGVILAIEEAVRDIDGVKRISSLANEGVGNVFVYLLSNADRNKVLQDVKNAVDSLHNLPEEAETPLISLLEHQINVLSIIFYGDQDIHVLNNLGEKVRTELLQTPQINTVSLSGIPSQEISVEISQDMLRNYNLTLEDVARKIKATSLDFSAGGVKSKGGELLLRVKERRNKGRDFANIPIITTPDGTEILLRDIASIKDTFADTDDAAYFNGHRAILLKVASKGEHTPLEVSAAVKKYLKELKSKLPNGISVTTFDDFSQLYSDRMSLLLRNGSLGLILVLVLLGLFLDVKLAFWVTMGIPVSFLGALLCLPFFGVSINMISLFSFIMALGIVVDDAIVVGENIYTHREGKTEGKTRLQAAIDGVKQVSVPVVFAVLTNIVAFIPLLYVEGVIGKVFKVIPIVVCLAFTWSLIEALFILPAHLAHSKKKKANPNNEKSFTTRINESVANGLQYFIQNYYYPLLEKSLRKRYLTVAIGLGFLIIVVGYIKSGRMEFSFSPKAEADIVIVALELPYGSPVSQTVKIQKRLVKSAQKILNKFGGHSVYKGIYTHIGTTEADDRVETGIVQGGHAASIKVLLEPSDQRSFSGDQFSAAWRKSMGDIPGVESIYFKTLEMGPPAGKPIDIQISYSDEKIMEKIAAELADELKKFSGTKDVNDGYAPGKPQLDFIIKPDAYSLGLTPAAIGRQVRSRFYGAEALRLQRGRHEVKVMVRLPEKERQTEQSIEKLLIHTPGGGEIPLGEAATVIRGRAYITIKRKDGVRVLHVTSDVNPPSAKGPIILALEQKILPAFKKKYPDLSWSLEGEQRETKDSMKSLGKNFIIALIAIFVMLGVIFRSYIQPLIVMISIPFGIVGAVIGHLIMGYNLSVVSMLGITALSGVVLNDSLILIDYANEHHRKGMPAHQAIVQAALRRFRPILLTTLTTFFGLTPMIFETSFQAKILVPMAISLGYGILFATFIILLIVPSLYLILIDFKHKTRQDIIN